MKQKKYFKNSIISLVITGIVLMPYLGFIPSVNAQTYSGGGSGYSYQNSGTGTSVSDYMKIVSPMIPKLQGCGQVLKNGIGTAVNAIKDLFSTADTSGGGVDGTNGTTSDLNSIWGDSEAQVSSVSVDSPTANTISGYIKSATEGTKKIVDVTAANKLCLDSVGKMISKILIRKLTDSTVKWINTGNFGEPFWPKDKQQFFGDIGVTEILKFNSEITNQTLYPFARSFMQNEVHALQSHFAQNAQYSLNKMISDTTPQYTSATFDTDFSSGGWNAWSALTQVPANNPIGFQLMASDELQTRLVGTQQSTAQDARDNLKESGGFLGQEQCASNPNITKESERQALIEGNPNLVPGTSDYDTWEQNNVCQKWEYVTPGKMIADASTKLVNYQDNALLSVNDLNDAIAAILDAAINKWGTDLTNTGLASLTPVDTNNQYDLSSASGLTRTQVEQDFTPTQANNTWLSSNPNFNIRTDLTQALIDTQRTYKSKLEDSNKTLAILNKTIYQLDYCIPGPHPGWEDDSRNTLSAVEDSIVSKTEQDVSKLSSAEIKDTVKTAGYIAGAIVGASIGTAVFPGFGTIIGAAIGVTVGLIVDVADGALDSDAKKLSLYYGDIVETFTGLHVDQQAKIANKEEVTNALDTILVRYIDKIHTYFAPEHLPLIAPDAAKEFEKTRGYTQMITNNKNEIIKLNGIIQRLTDMKGKIDALNPTSTVYENNLAPLISEFGRLSGDMVSGNDIASVDNLLKQEGDEIKYVYEDLLTGPYGCENDLDGHGIPWQIYLVKRATYPFPILYDYNNYTLGQKYPSPTVSSLHDPVLTVLQPYTTKTSSNAKTNMFTQDASFPWDNGNGFLNSLRFNIDGGGCPSFDCIYAYDLFKHINAWGVYVGTNQINNINDPTARQPSSFEQTIGVY